MWFNGPFPSSDILLQANNINDGDNGGDDAESTVFSLLTYHNTARATVGRMARWPAGMIQLVDSLPCLLSRLTLGSDAVGERNICPHFLPLVSQLPP